MQNVDEAREIARLREEGKTGYVSHRALSDDYELVGVIGEMQMAQNAKLLIDRSQRKDGDKGEDFGLRLSIDVKSAQIPNHLLVEVGKATAGVYVLAYATPQGESELLGWATRDSVLDAPVDWGGIKFRCKVNNHYIPRGELLPMRTLLMWITLARQILNDGSLTPWEREDTATNPLTAR